VRAAPQRLDACGRALHDAALDVDHPPLGVALHHLGNAAEIMTTALITSLFFRDNHESARAMLQQHGYISQMVSKSRLSRRLHRIKDIFIILFDAPRYTPMKIFEAIKPVRNGIFTD
jgi:hypothetical protein